MSHLVLPILAALGLALGALAPVHAAECRPEDLPPGVRAQGVPGCSPRDARPDEARARAGRNPGFIDLGNGTEVRIGGRVRLDAEGRR